MNEFYQCFKCGLTIEDKLMDFTTPAGRHYHIGCWGKTEENQKKTEREICLQKATEYITVNRNKEYGEPENNFQIIADLWKPIIVSMVDPEDITLIDIQPHHVAILLALLKVARLIESPGKFDTWVDAAGYIGCGWECTVEEKKR